MAGDPRSVMVFAAPADPRRREQLDALAFDGAAAARRDVLAVDVAERLDALALCDLYRVTPGVFTVILIGRDGGELERWDEPVETSELWELVDGSDGGSSLRRGGRRGAGTAAAYAPIRSTRQRVAARRLDVDRLARRRRPSAPAPPATPAESLPGLQVGLGRADERERLLRGRAPRRRRAPSRRSATVSASSAGASTTRALRRRSVSRAIFVSRCAWSSLAAWYSAFSLRSPCSRAAVIRSAIVRAPLALEPLRAPP